MPLADHDPRQIVALACQVLGDQNLGDMVWGHTALRDQYGRGMWMKAHLLGFEEVTPDDVLLVSWDGEVLEGAGRRHGEYPIHAEIMRARADVNFTVHTHSIHCVAFASRDEPLRPISHDACLFVPPDIPRFNKSGRLVSTKAQGQELATTLGDARAALLPNHGMVATGATVGQAIMATVLLDRACRAQLLAGEVKSWSPDEDAIAKRDNVWNPRLLETGWEYLVRHARNHANQS